MVAIEVIVYFFKVDSKKFIIMKKIIHETKQNTLTTAVNTVKNYV
jgi:hypothetical protein